MPNLPPFITTRKTFYKLIITANIFLGTVASAAVTGFPYMPGISLQGFTGDITQGFADALVPLFGHPDEILYIDPQGWFYDQDEYSVSGGLGIRKLASNSIFGAYVFTDYNHSANNHGFWFISPGIEELGDIIDFDANMYIPVGSRTNDLGNSFASNMSNYNYVQFSGHEEVDEIFNSFESVGMGGDAEIGYRLPFLRNNTKLYVGGYYFSPQDAEHISGGTARLEVPITNYASVGVSEAYDNVNHNTVKANLTLVMGGRRTHVPYSHNLLDRMVDPVHRNLDAVAGSSHSSQPITQVTQDTGTAAVIQSNIWFFTDTGSQDGTVTNNSCTAESPCDFTQSNLTGINNVTPSGATLYIESGSYLNLDGQVTLYNNQNMYGRTDGWIMPAQGSERPTLFGSLNLFATNLIDSIILLNDSDTPLDMGILIQDNANTTVNNSQIGSNSSDPTHAYRTGIQLGNSDNVRVSNSEINAFTSTSAISSDVIAGIRIEGTSNNTLLVKNSLITSETTADTGASSIGIFVGNTDGTTLTTNNQVTVTGSSISTQNMSDNPLANNGSVAIFIGTLNPAFSASVTNNSLNVSNSQLSAIAQDATTVIGIAIQADDNIVNSANNTITTTGMEGNPFFSFASSFFISGNGNTLTSTADHIMVNGDAVGGTNGFFVLGGTNNISILGDDIDLNAVGDNNHAEGVQIFSSGNVITMQNTQLTATTTGENSMALAVRIDNGMNNEVTLTNDVMTFTTTGAMQSGAGAVFEDGSLNSVEISDSQINATTSGDGESSAVLAFMNGDGNSFISSNNTVNATSSGDSAGSAGVLIKGSDNTISSTNDVMNLTSTGDNSIAAGYLFLDGINNDLTINNTTINATASGIGGNAYGVAANLFDMGAMDTINVTNSTFIISSTQSSAYGFFDGNFPVNNWVYDPQTLALMQISAPVEACKTKFNGVCTP